MNARLLPAVCVALGDRLCSVLVCPIKCDRIGARGNRASNANQMQFGLARNLAGKRRSFKFRTICMQNFSMQGMQTDADFALQNLYVDLLCRVCITDGNEEL